MVNTKTLKDVDVFTYFGSVLDTLGGWDKDVRIRIDKTRTAFSMMGSVWKASL